MTDLETMPVEDVDTRTDEITETGEPTSAHIVKTKKGENAAAVVLEARIMGTPIEALCGFVWVPSAIRSNCRCARSARASTRCTRRSTTACATHPRTDRSSMTRPDPELRIREAVRALLVTPDEHILLVRFEFPDATVWSLPGGGLDPGESHLEALHRELIEEVGLHDPVVGAHVWNRVHVIPHLDGRWDGQRDRYYVVEATEQFEPTPALELGTAPSRAAPRAALVAHRRDRSGNQRQPVVLPARARPPPPHADHRRPAAHSHRHGRVTVGVRHQT